MQQQEPSTAHFIAQGWVMMFLVFIAVLMMEFVTASVADDLSIFRNPDGQRMLRVVIFVVMLHALMPLLVWKLDAAWFRWTVLCITGVFTVAMIGHQWIHVLRDDRPVGLLNLLDITHHVLGLWVTTAAWRWVRETRSPMAAHALA
jgi:hypothetical protein